MATKPLPNEILNHSDIATKVVLNKTRCDHWANRIAYRMASQETFGITTKRPWFYSNIDRYDCQRTSHRDQTRGLLGALLYQVSAWDACRTVNQMIKIIIEWHTTLNATLPNQWPYKWLLRSKWILYQSCLPGWQLWSRPRTDRTYDPNGIHWHTVQWDDTECQITRW